MTTTNWTEMDIIPTHEDFPEIAPWVRGVLSDGDLETIADAIECANPDELTRMPGTTERKRFLKWLGQHPIHRFVHCRFCDFLHLPDHASIAGGTPPRVTPSTLMWYDVPAITTQEKTARWERRDTLFQFIPILERHPADGSLLSSYSNSSNHNLGVGQLTTAVTPGCNATLDSRIEILMSGIKRDLKAGRTAAAKALTDLIARGETEMDAPIGHELRQDLRVVSTTARPGKPASVHFSRLIRLHQLDWDRWRSFAFEFPQCPHSSISWVVSEYSFKRSPRPEDGAGEVRVNDRLFMHLRLFAEWRKHSDARPIEFGRVHRCPTCDCDIQADLLISERTQQGVQLQMFHTQHFN